MKNLYKIISLAIVTVFSQVSCIDNLLEQEPTIELGSNAFWKTPKDATYALMGAYNMTRDCFTYEQYMDGHGEFLYTHGAANNKYGGKYIPVNDGSNFDLYFKKLYGSVNANNYVIENVTKMLEKTNDENVRKELECIIGESRLLRGMTYFRLISLWGDVPYFDKIITQDEANTLTRAPISEIKKHIIDDFNYAEEKLPSEATDFGRASKPAAIAFRGKLQLYWACWNHFGWPELSTFTPNEAEAQDAYKKAAEDFKRVINDFGLSLFRNGEPGEIAELGSADKLPNYFYMFVGKTGNGDKEMIMSFTHGGAQTDNYKEQLVRDFGGRDQSNSQNIIVPTFELANRYQSTITGDFCEKLIPLNPTGTTDGVPNREVKNSSVNPESYANRDYRMKATILWDYEMIKATREYVPEGTTNIWHPYIFGSWKTKINIKGKDYLTYNGRTGTGYVFRKFVRDYEDIKLQREWGDYAWPVMRLADVYLMYAEAVNEAYGPQQDAIDKVNAIRRRGNLPKLASDKTSTKEKFFEAIEQERIVELVAEGHRGFDLRRWRALERVWGPPMGDGVDQRDVWGRIIRTNFRNAPELTYQRCYIFKIPQSERDRNPNLTQNTPWL